MSSLLGFQAYICAYIAFFRFRRFSGGPPGATSKGILIHAFSKFERRLNAVRHMVFINRRMFAHISHFFRLRRSSGGPPGGPPRGPCWGLAGLRRATHHASPVALRATDAEAQINARVYMS